MICAQAMVLIGEMWSKLPEAEKSAYQARAAKSREKYQAALAEYNASKKAAAKADAAAPAAEAAPKKKRKKPCGCQNFTARDSLVDFHISTQARRARTAVRRRRKKSQKNRRIKRERPYGRIAEPSKNCQCYL